MKIFPFAFAALALVASYAQAAPDAAPEAKLPFSNCWVESGPQLYTEALKIPDEVLQANWRALAATSNGQADKITFFRLTAGGKGKLALADDQSFNDIPSNDSEVIVQIGGPYDSFGGNVYADLQTSFGGAYAQFEPKLRVENKWASAEIYLQYESRGKDQYRDLRLHCTYLERVAESASK